MKNITYTDKKGREWSYQIPFEITCTLSNVVKKYTSEEYINKKIERFDGLDNLRKNYVSRDCKRVTKAASKQGKTEVTINDTVVQVKAVSSLKPGSLNFGTVAPLQPITYENNTDDSCANPAWMLDGKPCSTCAFNRICRLKDTEAGKRLEAKHVKKGSIKRTIKPITA